ncbi:branched-chain amino acid aminotransferase [Niallia taxi]|uniref:branched-chain amino acid aminotransferase n=1 Tax=Niallia taxi TaxID=2499688 RepID=UPI003981E99F
MIKANMMKYIEKNATNSKISVLPLERAYVLENELAKEENIAVSELTDRLGQTYMELANKESDEVVKDNLPASFLNDKISLLKANLEEYLYIESDLFDIIQVEGLTLEVDSVFRKYDALFGFKAPKKQEGVIRAYFAEQLGEENSYSLMFNGQDGLWDVNLPIENVAGFTEDLTIAQALELFYQFMFGLGKKLEEK